MSSALNEGGGQFAEARLDAVDRRILDALGEDARQAVAALARTVGISRAAAYSRLARLESSGVIDGYSVRINNRRAGPSVAAVILLSFRQANWRAVAEALREMPELEFGALTTGAQDALILVRARDIETLRNLVLERIQSLPTLRNSQTILVLDELVRKPFVLP